MFFMEEQKKKERFVLSFPVPGLPSPWFPLVSLGFPWFYKKRENFSFSLFRRLFTFVNKTVAFA